MGDAPPPRVSPHLWPPSLLLSETSSSCKGSTGHSASHWKSRDPHSGASGAQGLGVEPSSCSVTAHPRPSRLKLRPWSLLACSGPREAPWLTSSYRPMGPSGSLPPSPGGLSLALLQVTTQWPLTFISASVSNRNSRTSGVYRLRPLAVGSGLSTLSVLQASPRCRARVTPASLGCGQRYSHLHPLHTQSYHLQG